MSCAERAAIRPADRPPENAAVQVVEVCVGQLEQLAQEAGRTTQQDGVVPMTPHRARAHAANPYADADDVALLVAYQEGCCIGYVGVMPGRLRCDGVDHKVLWGSAFYVPPPARAAGVSMQLVMRLLALPCDLVIAAPSRTAAQIWRAMRIPEVGPLEYLTLKRVSVAARGSLIARTGRRLQRLWSRGRRPGQPVCRPLSARELHLSVGPWRFGPLDDLSHLHRLASTDMRPVAFERGPEAVRWTLEHPWILERVEQDPSGYYFSDVRDVFRYLALAIYQAGDDACCGYLTLSLSADGDESVLKLLDTAQPNGLPDAGLIEVVRHLAELGGVGRVELPMRFASVAGLLGAGWAPRTRTRAYFCHPHSAASPLARALDRLELDYCDGEHPHI